MSSVVAIVGPSTRDRRLRPTAGGERTGESNAMARVARWQLHVKVTGAVAVVGSRRQSNQGAEIAVG
jgi:hypothetical protein